MAREFMAESYSATHLAPKHLKAIAATPPRQVSQGRSKASGYRHLTAIQHRAAARHPRLESSPAWRGLKPMEDAMYRRIAGFCAGMLSSLSASGLRFLRFQNSQPIHSEFTGSAAASGLAIKSRPRPDRMNDSVVSS
jgi:hypothetical protein